MLAAALSRCCIGVCVLGWVGLGTGCWGLGVWEVFVLGVAPRDRSCARRDRTEGGAVALLDWRIGVGG
jgi:hypothetical protein